MNCQKTNNEYIGITNNLFKSPESFDSYDINIINLNDNRIWCSNSTNYLCLDCNNDFITLRKLIINNAKSNVILLLPQNIKIKYNYSIFSNSYQKSVQIKDVLESFTRDILSSILPYNYNNYINLIYEGVTTSIGKYSIRSDFTFNSCNSKDALTYSDISNKITTMRINERIIVSTVLLNNTIEQTQAFLETIGLIQIKEQYPDWLKELDRFDDIEQNAIIEDNNQIIVEAQKAIEKAQTQIEKNMYYKSVLIETGNQLVHIVFDIMQQLFECDLSNFEDLKKEDFRFEKNGTTFIGEIKGISTNVKNTNVSQVDTHKYNYTDSDDYHNEEVKTLLIINPLRQTPISQREPVHDEQITLAERNGCLIVLTETLLNIFERFINGEITSEIIIERFKEKSGLLKNEDFSD